MTDLGLAASVLWVLLAALAFWEKRYEAALFLLLVAIWSTLVVIVGAVR